MSDSGATRYDPFEDTGGWPFREAPPPDEGRSESGRDADALYASLGDTAIDSPRFEDLLGAEPPDEVASEDQRLSSSVDDDGEAEDVLPLSDPEPVESPVERMSLEEEAVELAAPASPLAAAPSVADEPLEAEGVAESAGVEEVVALPATLEAAPDGDDGQHAPGGFVVPAGPDVIEGGPHGFRRSVAVVVSRFNGDVTSRMLGVALAELKECHVAEEAVTVVPVPGSFELPLTALALAKTRRFSCIVALGCVIRGETPHFDLVATEAASGLQLAAIETGIPVAFGVLTCETREQAEARIDRAADAVRTALEMADLFTHVRTRAAG